MRRDYWCLLFWTIKLTFLPPKLMCLHVQRWFKRRLSACNNVSRQPYRTKIFRCTRTPVRRFWLTLQSSKMIINFHQVSNIFIPTNNDTMP
jgi:hypothetical protein